MFCGSQGKIPLVELVDLLRKCFKKQLAFASNDSHGSNPLNKIRIHESMLTVLKINKNK